MIYFKKWITDTITGFPKMVKGTDVVGKANIKMKFNYSRKWNVNYSSQMYCYYGPVTRFDQEVSELVL